MRGHVGARNWIPAIWKIRHINHLFTSLSLCFPCFIFSCILQVSYEKKDTLFNLPYENGSVYPTLIQVSQAWQYPDTFMNWMKLGVRFHHFARIPDIITFRHGRFISNGFRSFCLWSFGLLVLDMMSDCTLWFD